MPAKCTFSFWEGGMFLLIPPSHRRVFKNKFYGCIYPVFLPRFDVIYRIFLCGWDVFTFFSLA